MRVNQPSQTSPPFGVCSPSELPRVGHAAADVPFLRIATWSLAELRGPAAGHPSHDTPGAVRPGSAAAGGPRTAAAASGGGGGGGSRDPRVRLNALLKDARFVHHLDVIAVQDHLFDADGVADLQSAAAHHGYVAFVEPARLTLGVAAPKHGGGGGAGGACGGSCGKGASSGACGGTGAACAAAGVFGPARGGASNAAAAARRPTAGVALLLARRLYDSADALQQVGSLELNRAATLQGYFLRVDLFFGDGARGGAGADPALRGLGWLSLVTVACKHGAAGAAHGWDAGDAVVRLLRANEALLPSKHAPGRRLILLGDFGVPLAAEGAPLRARTWSTGKGQTTHRQLLLKAMLDHHGLQRVMPAPAAGTAAAALAARHPGGGQAAGAYGGAFVGGVGGAIRPSGAAGPPAAAAGGGPAGGPAAGVPASALPAGIDHIFVQRRTCADGRLRPLRAFEEPNVIRFAHVDEFRMPTRQQLNMTAAGGAAGGGHGAPGGPARARPASASAAMAAAATARAAPGPRGAAADPLRPEFCTFVICDFALLPPAPEEEEEEEEEEEGEEGEEDGAAWPLPATQPPVSALNPPFFIGGEYGDPSPPQRRATPCTAAAGAPSAAPAPRGGLGPAAARGPPQPLDPFGRTRAFGAFSPRRACGPPPAPAAPPPVPPPPSVDLYGGKRAAGAFSPQRPAAAPYAWPQTPPRGASPAGAGSAFSPTAPGPLPPTALAAAAAALVATDPTSPVRPLPPFAGHAAAFGGTPEGSPRPVKLAAADGAVAGTPAAPLAASPRPSSPAAALDPPMAAPGPPAAPPALAAASGSARAWLEGPGVGGALLPALLAHLELDPAGPASGAAKAKLVAAMESVFSDLTRPGPVGRRF